MCFWVMNNRNTKNTMIKCIFFCREQPTFQQNHTKSRFCFVMDKQHIKNTKAEFTVWVYGLGLRTINILKSNCNMHVLWSWTSRILIKRHQNTWLLVMDNKSRKLSKRKQNTWFLMARACSHSRTTQNSSCHERLFHVFNTPKPLTHDPIL